MTRARPGRFKGQKRADKRYWDEQGIEWASRFEYEVHNGFQLRAGAAEGIVEVRRTGPRDSFAYARKKRKANCLECGSDKIVQWCSITQDLYVRTQSTVYYVEAKGHFPASKRASYRAFRTYEGTRDVVLRFVLQKNERATKGSLMLDYFKRYFKGVDVIVWAGPESIPQEWLR